MRENSFYIARYQNGQIDRKINLTWWIPVEERLPEDATQYLVTLLCGMVDIDTYENGKWRFWGKDQYEDVIAWIPLPEPYKPE